MSSTEPGGRVDRIFWRRSATCAARGAGGARCRSERGLRARVRARVSPGSRARRGRGCRPPRAAAGTAIERRTDDTQISRETNEMGVRHRRNDGETGGRDDAFESSSGGRTSDSSVGSGFSSSTSAAASLVSVMARSAEPRRSARIATPSKAPLEPLRETDEVVRAGAATRAAAGAARAARLPATGARHRTLVAVTDAMVRCGLRASRAERLWMGEGGDRARGGSLDTEISESIFRSRKSEIVAWLCAAR